MFCLHFTQSISRIPLHWSLPPHEYSLVSCFLVLHILWMPLIIHWLFFLRFFCWFLLFSTLHTGVWGWVLILSCSVAMHIPLVSHIFPCHLQDQNTSKFCISNLELSLSHLNCILDIPTWKSNIHLKIIYKNWTSHLSPKACGSRNFFL